MKMEEVGFKIKAALEDKIITAKEASEIRDEMLELSSFARGKFKDKVDIKELTPDARTIINDLYADRDNLFAFSQKEKTLIKSIPFQRVLPNFASLKVDEQKQVLKTFEPILRKFPNFFEKLAKNSNSNYGKGFQFFFTNQDSQELGKIIKKDMVGIVNPGANVIKNKLLNDLLSPFGSIEQLDVGSMYTDSIGINELLSHEMAHVIHLNFLNDDQRDKIGNLYDHAKKTNSFISTYAKTNPYEYFADSVEAYFSSGFGKAVLEKTDPEMHNFIKSVYETKPQYGQDGNLFNDPENISLTYANSAGEHLAGVTVSRESSVVTLEHFNGGTVSELGILANQNSIIAKGGIGIKAAWKPWNEPVSVYGTAGVTANAGMAGGKATSGIGGFVGAGFDIYHFNAEVRENFVTNGNGPEVRVGYKLEF
jgi:hypothetical protein